MAAFPLLRERNEKPQQFYENLNTACEREATHDTEVFKHFVSDMLHRSSPNSQRRAQKLMKLAPRIETENIKYHKECMYKRLAIEAENAVFGVPHSPREDDGNATTSSRRNMASMASVKKRNGDIFTCVQW